MDLKAFSEKFYKEIVNGEMKPVLDALVTIRKLGTWNEIVYLVVPTLNDSDEEFQALAKWVKTDMGPDVPLHFSRFHPEYLLKNLPPTPLETLERAKAIADAEGLHYVYIGNVPGHPGGKHLLPQVPQGRRRARGLHRERRAASERQVPLLPATHRREYGRNENAPAVRTRPRPRSCHEDCSHTVPRHPHDFACQC